MSYTNLELVRHHMATSHPATERVTDQAVGMPDNEWITFHQGAVDAGSVRMKVVRSPALARVTVVLGTPAVHFSDSPVVPGTTVVASDSSLGTIYVENRDYIIDHVGGYISNKEGSALSPGDTAVVWYLPYSLYQAGVDYTLDASHGRLKRLASGDIAAGETVVIEFTPLLADITEELLISAVTMANGLIECQIDPNRQFETNTVLEAAATFRALEIVSRAAAGRELTRPASDQKTATAWLELAEAYGDKADTMLAAFRPPFENRHAPVKA